MKKVAFIILYFGKLPNYYQLFFDGDAYVDSVRGKDVR